MYKVWILYSMDLEGQKKFLKAFMTREEAQEYRQRFIGRRARVLLEEEEIDSEDLHHVSYHKEVIKNPFRDL